MRPWQGLHPAGCVGIGVDLTVCFRATDEIEGVANLFWLVMKGSHLQIVRVSGALHSAPFVPTMYV